MANLLRAHIELVPLDSIDPIMDLDSKVTTDISRYKRLNRLGYYICINSWLHIARHHAPYAWLGLLELISTKGLFSAIKECSEQSDLLLEGKQLSGFARSLLSDLHDNVLPKALMLLRYPKRFSPQMSDKLSAESVRQFLNVENANKLKQRRLLPRFLVERVRSFVHSLHWDVVREPSTDDGIFTSGVTYEGARTVGQKLEVLAKVKPSYFHPIMGEPIGAGPQEINIDSYGPGLLHKDKVKYLYDVRPVKLQPVPKTYKAARIIAMEPTYTQMLAKSIARQIEDILPSAIPLHDQTQNQILAYEGSKDGILATIDLSHASDSVTKTLIVELFPSRISEILLKYVGTHIDYPDHGRRLMHMFSTAGNALTFIIESIVFWAIAEASIQYKIDIDGTCNTTCSVYGDDIIVSTEVMPFTIMFLEGLGFTVNTTKSFGPGTLYRESCGAEYINGIDVSSIYYPRTPIRGSITSNGVSVSNRAYTTTSSMMALVSLQRRLFRREYSASMFIYELLREAMPSFTTTAESSEFHTSDLLSYNSIIREGGAPSGVWVRFPQSRLLRQWNTEIKREGHLAPSLIVENRELSPLEEDYLYKVYLQYGPLYDSPFDELLRLSSPRRRTLLRADATEFRWTIHYI